VQELGGSIARQIAKLASGNIPYHGRHAHFVSGGVGCWSRKLSALLVSVSSNPLLSGISNFLGNFVKFRISGVPACCPLGTDCELVIRWSEKLYCM